MRYVIDKVALNGDELVVFGDTTHSKVEVWSSRVGLEFPSRIAAFQYLAEGFRAQADLRNVQPGQQVTLPMANGESKTVNVVMNDQDNMTVLDLNTGAQMLIPHLQPGQQPLVQNNPNQNTDDSGQPEDPEQGDGLDDEGNIKPGTGIVMSKRHLRSRRQALSKKADFPHRSPQNCKHDNSYLQRKDPSDAEKECPQCGMVYAAERKIALSKKAAPMDDPGQLTPNSTPPSTTELDGPEYAPAGDVSAPDPSSGTSNNRPLSRHEIIQEAEILIRNALFKGVKIGVYDLVEYMKQQYGNSPDELYEGASKAWEKVIWEEEDELQNATGPGAEQGPQDGAGANPALEHDEQPGPSLEDISKKPQNGPRQVHV